MRFRVRLTPRAAEDADRIYRRVVQAAPLAGQNWYNRLIDAIDSLAELPERCLARQIGGLTVRKLLFGRKPYVYGVYFEIADDTVTILHIRRWGRREPSEKALLN